MSRESDDRAIIALRMWVHYGSLHRPGCPEDDTCDCPIAKMVNEVLAERPPAAQPQTTREGAEMPVTTNDQEK